MIFTIKKIKSKETVMAEKIIILSGKQYSGKDTAAKILLEKLQDFKRIGLGDAIKIEYSEKTGLSVEEIEKNKHLYRPDLIALGNKRRAQDCDYWIKKVIALTGNIIVPDVRVKRELEFFKEAHAYTIRVESDKEKRALRGRLTSADDPTETALDDIQDWNAVLYNNSSYEDFKSDVLNLTDKINQFFQ